MAGNIFKQQGGIQQMLKDGGQHFAGLDDAVVKNIEAVAEVANLTRTSLGPFGMKKIVINHLDKQFVTSHAGTILHELDVMHPAAKLVVMSAKSQEEEFGDGTNLVVVFAGSLMKQAMELLKQGIHATDIIKGFELGKDHMVKTMESAVCWNMSDPRDQEHIATAICGTIMAKHNGIEKELSARVAQACLQVMPEDIRKFDTDSVRVVKICGGSFAKSEVVSGMVIPREPVGEVRTKGKCKVAVFGVGLEMTSTETKGTVLLENAEQLFNFTRGEEQKMDDFIHALKEAGVEVAISGGAISEICAHYLNKYGILALKITSKFELKRLCKVLGATALVRLGAPTPEEMGWAEAVAVDEISSQKVTIIRSPDAKISTLVLRGPTPSLLDELERAVEDAVHVVKSAARDPRFVAGAGAVEMEMSHQGQLYGQGLSGLEQYAAIAFAKALEEVPTVLAENAGLDAANTLAVLSAAHARGDATVGVDMDGGAKGVDAKEARIFDHLETKLWGLQLATEAALTVLRVDHIIVAKQAGGPRTDKRPGNMGDDD